MRNEHYFTFAGRPSRDFGLGISGEASFVKPQRRYTSQKVPGRNGDLTIDEGTFENVRIVYPGYIIKDFSLQYRGLFDFLNAVTGYGRLEDTIDHDVYRMARYAGPADPKVLGVAKAGTFNVEFDCKPQRFLKTGEVPVEFTANGTIYNPTNYGAKPLLRLYGTGTFTISGQTITVASASGYTDIDVEIMEAYKGDANCNANVSLPDDFVIKAGANQVTFSGLTKAVITPRWWTI